MNVSHSSLPASPLPTSEARSAFEAVESELRALDPIELLVPRVDVQRSAAVAHSIAMRDQQTLRRTRFEPMIGAGLYPTGRPRRLARLSLAAWFARQQQLSHRALADRARVPDEVQRQAREHRGRLLRALEYWCDDDAQLMEEVAAIRKGAGYLDLANDLEQLADIHQRPTVRAQLEQDTKHLRPDDVERARALARSIFSGLGIGEQQEHQRWTDLCRRAWTLLLREYEEHRAAGVFLFRHHEDVEHTYPSLVTVARSGRTYPVLEDDDRDGAVSDLEAAAE